MIENGWGGGGGGRFLMAWADEKPQDKNFAIIAKFKPCTSLQMKKNKNKVIKIK